MFLHHVLPGPASQSYGLAVAQLAGVPAVVIQRAREHLSRLETTSLPHDSTQVTKAQDAPQVPHQSDLFASLPHPAIEKLGKLQLDDMTPRQAIEMLYQLKNLL